MSKIHEDVLVNDGALPPDDFHENIDRIREIAGYDLELPPDIEKRLKEESSHLLVDPDVLVSAAVALQAGHLILQGPPGTGKSSLARSLCRAFHCNLLPVTAHDDWTTYEVIGRQTIKINEDGQEEIIPVNGFFTEAVVRCASTIVHHFDSPDEPQGTWLLIDELNRAHIDKAFGELFTVLGTDELVPITLSYQGEGNRQLITPKRFRLIATINTIDRQFVNSLSQGLKRRFTFITVDIPPKRVNSEDWGTGASLASREFLVVLRRAVERVASSNEHISSTELMDLVQGEAKPALEALFNFAEEVRYAGKGDDIPYLPIGTAQLIDVVELFLHRAMFNKSSPMYRELVDWAASVKLAPLFDADTITPQVLETFATNLKTPFNKHMKRELLQIVSAGQFYVG